MKYKFSVDWFDHNIPTWDKYLAEFKGKPITAVELGVYEGRSATWLLDNILTHPKAHLICVDTWEGSAEHKGINMAAVKERFDYNIGLATEGEEQKASIFEGTTVNFLFDNQDIKADLIYIDASHEADAVLADAVLSNRLLKPGGILIFDDYMWGDGGEHTPKPAIDAFITVCADQYDILHKGYQVILKKKNAKSQDTEIG